MPPRKRASTKPKPTSDTESTPIADEVEKQLKASDGLHYDETDVPAALERQTDDGKGDEDPGPSDWNGYATEGVEQTEESK